MGDSPVAVHNVPVGTIKALNKSQSHTSPKYEITLLCGKDSVDDFTKYCSMDFDGVYRTPILEWKASG